MSKKGGAMKHKPLVSIIVPIYNVELYLDHCVQSIVDQTYKNLEIILVDDGSPDNCPAMCDSWASKDSRIKVIHKKNGGLSDARNAGLQIASGELISFIDSDDWVETNFVQSLYSAMEEANAEIAECSTHYVTEDGTIIKTRKASSGILDCMTALRKLVLEDGVYQTVWNKLYRRELIQGIPFAIGKYNEDEFWTYQVIERIQRFAAVEMPLYNYLQRSTSIIGTGYNIRRLDGLEARFQRMQHLQKYDELATLTRQQFMLDCMWHLQCALRCLKGQEQQSAIEKILIFKDKTLKVDQMSLKLIWKYIVWYSMFRLMPIFTSQLRNLLKIGL